MFLRLRTREENVLFILFLGCQFKTVSTVETRKTPFQFKFADVIIGFWTGEEAFVNLGEL